MGNLWPKRWNSIFGWCIESSIYYQWFCFMLVKQIYRAEKRSVVLVLSLHSPHRFVLNLSLFGLWRCWCSERWGLEIVNLTPRLSLRGKKSPGREWLFGLIPTWKAVFHLGVRYRKSPYLGRGAMFSRSTIELWEFFVITWRIRIQRNEEIGF